MRDRAAPKPPKKPRPVHVAALKRADRVVKVQRARQQRQQKLQQAKAQRAAAGGLGAAAGAAARSTQTSLISPAQAASIREGQRRLQRIGQMKVPQANVLHELDTIGKYTVGLGMVRPSRAPGNVLQNLGVGTHGLPHDTKQPSFAFNRPLTTTEFERYQRTGVPPRNAIAAGHSQDPGIIVPGRGLISAASRRLTRGAQATHIAEETASQAAARARRIPTVGEPRTLRQAQAHLNRLDRQYRKIVTKVMAATEGKPSDFADVTRRRNMQAKRRANRGLPPLPTVSSEMWSRAEGHLAKASEGTSAEAQRLKAFLQEREQLRNAINEQAFPLEGGPVDLGRHFPPAKAVETGKVFRGPMTPEEARGVTREALSQSLMGMRRGAAEQKQIYKQAYAERAGLATEAGQKAGGGLAGYEAERQALSGAMPRVQMQKLKTGALNQHDLEGLIRDIDNQVDTAQISFWDGQTAKGALLKAFQDGVNPSPHEIDMLARVFGKDAAEVMASNDFARRVARNAVSVLNLPRALMASIDVSFPGRQGLGILALDPKIWAKGFPRQFHGLVSERYYQETLDRMHQDPYFQLADESGVKFTELGKDPTRHEEPFATNVLTNRPVKYNPVRASARAYTLYGDYVRLEAFKKLVQKAERQGVDVENKAELRDIAKVVNTLSGRGGGRRLQQASPVANAMFFAPQLIASRVNMLNPAWYSRHIPVGPTSRFATRQAKGAGIRLGAGLGAVLGGAAYGGAQVVTDPRNADFAKIKLGNTRIDIAGGLAQYPRAAAQIGTGTVISSTTGKKMKLGPGLGDMSRFDVAERFAASKLAPPASAAYDLLKGKTYTGQPLTVQNTVGERLVPLSIQDARDLYHQSGNVPAALGAYGLSAVGEGVQTYGPKDPAKAVRQRSQELHSSLRANVEHFFGRPLTPEIKQALRLREIRDVYMARNTDQDSSAQEKFNAQVDLLRRLKKISPAQAHKAKKWAAGTDEHKVRTETTRVMRKYFGGTVLEHAAKRIRERGGKFYLGDTKTWGLQP